MYMHKRVGKKFFSTFNNRLVIMANSNSADTAGARFMKALNDISGSQKIEYYGFGGQRMMHNGLSESEYDINNFVDKTFYTWRKTRQHTIAHNEMRWSSWNWVNAHYRKNADHILDELESQSFIKATYRFRPSAVISFDNEYFSIQMMKRLNEYYYKGSVAMPSKHYYNRFIKDFRRQHEALFDYMHYTIPQRTATPGEYFFPGQHVGQHGVYDALKHLMSLDPEQKHLVGSNNISISRKYFSGDIESTITKVKAAFREKHKINEDSTVLFFSPGNEKNEALFTFETVKRGVEEFLLKYSSPTSLSPIAKPLNKFHTIISVEEGSAVEAYIKERLEQNGWKGSYTVVTNHKNQHYEAMAASDIGMMYDGQMVGSAAACHLPTMILLDMRMHHQWYHDLFNRWWNSMVTIADKDIYPEYIGGQAWFGKI